MGCIDYSSKFYGMVERQRKRLPLDQFNQWLGDTFADAETILNAIENGDWGKDFTKEVIREKVTETPRKEYSDEGFFTLQNIDRSTLSFYGSETSEGRIAHNKMINTFKKNIIKRLIYDYETKSSPNLSDDINGVSAVNKILFNYKQELMRDLWKVLGVDYSENYSNDRQFTKQLVKTLSAYERSLHKKDVMSAYESYVILKNFDNLLKTHIDVVSVNKGYDNSPIIGRDMYEYKGPSMKRDSSIGKESADANDYTGSIVKLLLDDYFPEIINGQPDPTLKIGLVGFNRVMTHVIEWVENSKNVKLISELNKGANCNWDLILDAFERDIKDKQGPYASVLKSKLSGIRNYIFAKDANLPYDIINSFNRHVRDVYGQNYSEYVFSRSLSGGNAVSNSITNDYFIDVQLKNVLRIVQSKVDLFRTNTDEFENFCERHNIEIKGDKITINQDGVKTHRDEPYTVKVVWDTKAKRYQFNREIVRDDVDNDVMSEFISDLFDTVIPDDYRDILNSINSSNLFDTFFTAIMTTIAAGSNKFDNFKYQWGQQLDTYAYSSDMQSAGKFFAQVYGGETINVVKNKEGNNLPLYSIGSAVRKIKRIIGDVKSALTNAYSSNIFVRKPEILKRVITRSQTDMHSSIKSSKDNSIPEIATVEVIHDFHENLYNNNGVIWMQPICYADKSTHTMFEIDTDSDTIKVDGDTIKIKDALIQIANGQRSEKLINAIEQRVFIERKSKLKHQVIESINRFTTIFDYNYGGWSNNFVTYKSSEEQIKKSWNKIREQVKKIKNVKKLRELFKKYNDSHDILIDLIENYDFGTGVDGNLDVNLMFNDDLNVYVFSTDNKEFKSRLNFARRLTAQDYWEQGLKIMGLDHISIKERFFTDSNKRWYDSTNYEVFPYRIYKPDYKTKTKSLITITANSSDSKYFTDLNYLVELNPIFESHFLMKLLYGTPMKELMLGSTYAYNSKASFKGDPKNSKDVEKFNSDVRAAKIIEETKRALYCGATTTTYLQGLSYGVPEIANVACVSDLQGLVFNPKGDRDQTDVHDGSGWVSPFWAIQTNESLGDASVGWNKKTIYGHIDNVTGVFTEIKWAEFALSNQYRKNSPINVEFSAERMFKKMHNKSIPDFRFNDIDLQDFYSTTSSINSDKKPGILTHQKPVYYFDYNNGKYYEIISISNDGQNVTVTKNEVNEKGVRIGNTITNETPIIINSIYDLDQLFGGAFCKERDPKTGYLVDSDANNYIVNNIICENDLKDYMIHIVANKSAIKVGQKNLNSDNIFAEGNNDDLQTFEISTKYGGVIMDADHEIEDSEVREMGQLVSALMQEGNSASEAKEIYTEIGEVVYENVKKYIDASENIDKTDLYNRLGDALLRAFATQDRDVIGLAQAFISKFEQGDQKYQIPFSSATIAPAFMSAVSSVLTKQGIRRTFPGVGAVQVPGRGVMMTYKIGNLNYDLEGAVKLAAKQGVTLEQALSLDSPFIEQINSDEIDFEDTLIVDGQMIKITDIKSYDYYRNIYKQPILRHNFQPRDLLAPVPKFSVNGKIYSIYDLDAVRKCNYIGSILSKKVKTSDEDIANFAQIFDNPEEFVSISKNKKELESLLQIYQKEADTVIKTISAIAKIGTGKLPMQKAFDLEGEEVTVDEVFATPGQIIMGKAYADKLGISKFDNIANIKARGPRFFESQLRSALAMPPESMKNKYDAVAYLNDGTKALIVIGDGISAADKLGETTIDTTFKEINGVIYKNNTEEICEASDIECRKYTSENGTEYSVFVIRSLDVLDKLNESKMIQMIRYNYRNDNYKQLLLYNHDIEINEDGTFTQPLDVSYPIFDQITHTTTGEYGYMTYDSVQNDLPRILRQDEIAKFVKKVETLANRKYDAFEKSLRFIGTRIPAQSMQSFMPLEVVCFTNSELNDVYVPHTLTWVAGSDYDIDKLYMMGYSLTNSGELFTYSNLADYYNIDDILKLPEARGRKFSQSTETSTNHITYDELASFINDRNLSSISKVLKNQSDDTRISFEQGDLDDKTFGIWKRRFIKTLNTHERTRLNPNSRTSALKNRIVSQIETLMLDPINIINMLNPISMDNAKDAASKTTLGNREKLMNYDVPTSMMIMQYQNMLGKNVIGSAASGLKAYFGELTYFNNVVENIYHQILNNDSPQNIYNNIKRIVFDGKYNSSDIRILGNTPLQKIIDLIQLKPEYKTLVLNDISYNSKMQSHLKDYIEGQSLNFEKLLQKLQEIAWQYNTAQNISEVLSAATDNAKELILAKINATLEFSDIYTYLITTGVSIPEIADFMTSPIFNIVSKFAKSDIFATTDGFHNLERTINFVLDEEPLYVINGLERTLKLFLSKYNESHTKDSDIYHLLRTNQNSRTELIKFITEICKKEKAKLGKGYNQYGEFNEEFEMPVDSIDPESMTPVKPKTTYHEYLAIYNYVVRHLIPKNEMLDSLDYNSAKKSLKTLQDKILPGVEEQKAIAAFFSINKGIQTKDWDEYNWIEKQNKNINSMYFDRKLENPIKFDFVRFTQDENYRKVQIDQFEKIKTTFNVLDVITNVDHFWEMLKTVGLNRNLIETSAFFRFERNLEKELLGKTEILSKADTKSIPQKDWRILSNYTRDVITLNWFMRQPDLTISIPEGWDYYNPNKSNIRKPDKFIAKETNERYPIKLNTQEGIATFKRVVENYIIPTLKNDSDFKNNMFIQYLRRDAVADTGSQEFIRKYAFPFSLINIEKGSTFEKLYESIVKSFNRDMYKDIGAKFGIGSWSLGDLFFVYNLIVNKEGIGKSSMTKIFEDSINYGNEVKTAESYYNYIKMLDSVGFDLNELRYNIDDLKMRLSESSSAYNYGVSVDKTDKKNPVILIAKDLGGKIRIPILGRNLSDFTFNMWKFGSNGYETLPSLSGISITNFNKMYEPKLDNKEVLHTIVDLMVERIGSKSKAPIKVVTSADIQIMESKGELQFATQESYSNTLNAKSFIYNGVVYINSDNTELDSPIHELFHIICAGLKFNRRKAVRELYYKLLNDIAGINGEAAKYYDELGNAYSDKHGSDKKEEVLVRALSDKFKNEFTSNWSKLISDNVDEMGNKIESLYSHQLKQAIIDTLNETLGTSISENIKEDDLGNYTLNQAIVLFKSKLFELDGDWLTKTSITHNQTIATIKDRLVKTGDLKIGENC